MVRDIGFQPGHLWRSGPRLPHLVVIVVSRLGRDQPRRVRDLAGVKVGAAAGAGRHRDGVRGEHQTRVVAQLLGQAVAAASAIDSANISTNSGWSKYCRSLTSSGARSPAAVAAAGDVLDVLSAAGVATPRRRGEHRRATNTVVAHGRDGVLDVRLPVAVAEVHRQVRCRRRPVRPPTARSARG